MTRHTRSCHQLHRHGQAGHFCNSATCCSSPVLSNCTNTAQLAIPACSRRTIHMDMHNTLSPSYNNSHKKRKQVQLFCITAPAPILSPNTFHTHNCACSNCQHSAVMRLLCTPSTHQAPERLLTRRHQRILLPKALVASLVAGLPSEIHTPTRRNQPRHTLNCHLSSLKRACQPVTQYLNTQWMHYS